MNNHPLRFTAVSSRLRQHQSFLLVLIVFLTARLLLPFVFRNGSYFVEQAPDIGDYLRWGMLADSHLYPFVNYWSEYPPLFAWSIIGLYRLSLLLPAWLDQRLWFSIIMQLAMTLFDLGSVILVYAIAQRFSPRSQATRAAALFAASFILAYGASGWYEPVPLFFLLLTLYLTLRDRYAWSAATAAIGLMTKLVPILIVPIALQRLTGWRRRSSYLAGVAVLSIGLLLPFVITGHDYVLAFVRATLNRPSWLSIWALFDGNLTFGTSVPIIDRFSPQNVGVTPVSALPLPLITLAFAVLFVILYTRRIDWRDARQSTAFAGITVILFLLWSKGFSGQFTVYVLPFVALLLPNLRGAVYLALLSVLWVAEWPLAFQMMEGQSWFLAWLIIVRTLVLIILIVEFAVNLFPHIARNALRMTRYTLLLCWLTVPVVGIAAVNGYVQTRVAADPATPAIDLIRAQKHDAAPLVFAETKLYRRLYTAARPLGEVLLLPGSKHVPNDVRVQWLNDLIAHGPFWLISDEGDPETRDENLKTEQWVLDRACPIDSMSAGAGRVTRFTAAAGGETHAVQANFNDELSLDGYRLSQATANPGAALCIELDWKTLKTPAGDYTVYVHVIDPEGKLVAQNDMQPRNGFAPTSHWTVGATLVDRHGVILPDNLPAGEYAIQVGLYRSDDQSPVPSGAISLTKLPRCAVIIMSDLWAVLSWWLIIQALGLAVWPLAFRLFRWLPDRGYLFAKPLGLLIVSYVFWLLLSLHLLPNTIVTLLIVFAGVVVGSGWSYRREKTSLLAWLREHRRLVISYELLFAIAFIGWAVFRAQVPDVSTAEKPMEIAFINAIGRSTFFPPHDPWLAGYPIAYYYFGYVMLSVFGKLSSVSAGTLFSLGNAFWFALSAASAFAVVANLVLLTARKVRHAVVFGTIGAIMLVLMGNLEAPLEVSHALGWGSPQFWTWLDVQDLNEPDTLPQTGHFVWPLRSDEGWWWRASWLIHDYPATSVSPRLAAVTGLTPDPNTAFEGLIDEFPQFSFLLGDLHPHSMNLSFVLLAMGLALNLYQAGRTGEARSLWRIPLWLVYPLILGGISFMNTWDMPTYGFLMIAAFNLGKWQADRFRVRDGVLDLLLLFGLSWLLYLPFYQTFTSQVAGFWPNLFSGTRAPQFFLMFGPFIVIGALFGLQLVVETIRARRLRPLPFGLLALGGAVGLTVLAAGAATALGAVMLRVSNPLREWWTSLLAH